MRPVIVHAHIFKNAGTTFDFSLRHCFGSNFIDHREDREFLHGRNDYLISFLEAHPDIRAISSHSLHFRITDSDNLLFFPVYFLRHPIARVMSVYTFEKNQQGVDTEGARRAKEMDFNDFVAWYLEAGSPATIRNVHTIFLSGRGPSPDDMTGKFKAAMHYLDASEALFPIVERYDESMLVLEQSLRRYFPDINLAYKIRNVSDRNYHRPLKEKVDELLSRLDADTAKALLEKNHYDLALYDSANQKLDDRILRMDWYQRDKTQFAERCAQMAREDT